MYTFERRSLDLSYVSYMKVYDGNYTLPKITDERRYPPLTFAPRNI